MTTGKRYLSMALLLVILLGTSALAGHDTIQSVASGTLSPAQYGTELPVVDFSRCYLKGEEVPCVGHAYDKRVVPVPIMRPSPCYQRM